MTAPVVTLRELDWAPGHYQWDCATCGAVGNITPPMIRQPKTTWHTPAGCDQVKRRARGEQVLGPSTP